MKNEPKKLAVSVTSEPPETVELVCADCGVRFQFTIPPRYFRKYRPERCRVCSDYHCRLHEQREEFDRRCESAWWRVEQWHNLCPALYLESDRARFPAAAFEKIMAWQNGAKGLLIHGVTGHCKTRMAWCLLKRLHFEGARIMAFDATSFKHECGSKFYEDPRVGAAWIDSLAKSDVLFFDDLGKMKLTETVESELFGLFDARFSAMKPVIVTTNFVGVKLNERMTDDRGEPFIRRLREFCESIAV